jgi:hypothetical protein
VVQREGRFANVGSIVIIVYIFLLVPLGCFLVAAVAEVRSYEKGPAFFLRMVEIVAGVIALWAMTRVGQSVELSWTMVCASLLLGGLSLVSEYASRVALRCVLSGSALLAFLWYFKGAYHH